MIRFTSFKDVIENVYGIDILDSVAEYLESNTDKLEEPFNTMNSAFEPKLHGI